MIRIHVRGGFAESEIGGAGISRRHPWLVRSADRQFIRHAAGQFLRPARFSRILHWRRDLGPWTTRRIFLRRLARLPGLDRRIFLRIDSHLNRYRAMALGAQDIDRAAIGRNMAPSGARAARWRRG
jgi:hypothetical protein